MESSHSRRATRSIANSSTHETPSQVNTSTSSVQSPLTPTRFTRFQEKNALVSLNDRLAAYVDRHQKLENEKAFMSKQLAMSEETMSTTLKRLRDTYDKELLDSRRMIDAVAKDRARLELENNQFRKDTQDAKEKLDKKTKECVTTTRNLSQIESRFQDLTAQNNKLVSERDDLVYERRELQDELTTLQKEFESVRIKFDQESLIRSDIENQLKTKSQELNFKIRCLEEEVPEIKIQEIREVDDRLKQEYDLKFQESLQELRVEYEGQLRSNKDEMDGIYEQKVADLKAQLWRVQSSSKSKGEELSSLSARCETLSKSLARVESERQDHLNEIKELEDKLNSDHAKFLMLLTERDNEIDRLNAERNALLPDFQALMDNKVSMDNEIATCAKFLDILDGSSSPMVSSLRAETHAAESGTPNKRKRSC